MPERPDDERYLDRELRRLRRKLEKSSVFLGLITENFMRDPQCLMQLGMAVVLDKPIVMIVLPGTVVPENLKRLARIIEEVQSPEDVEPAMARLIARTTELR